MNFAVVFAFVVMFWMGVYSQDLKCDPKICGKQITLSEIAQLKVNCPHLYMVFRNLNETVLPVGTFRACAKTRILDLSNNAIEIIKAGAFLGLRTLTVLYLRNNKLTEIEPGTFHTLTKLETFVLTGNLIKSIPDYEFTSKHLKYFNLNNNLLDMVSHSAMVTLKKMRLLDLAMNRIKSIYDTSLINLEPGVTLILSDNMLEDIDLKFNTTIRSKATSVLKASGNQIKGLKPGSLGDFHRLRLITLDLSFNEIEDIQIGTFRNFGSIQNLFLSHNKMGVLENHVFSELKNLRLIDLSYNKITSKVFNMVLPSTIKYMNFSNNQIAQLEDYNWVLHSRKRGITLDISSNQIKYLDANLFCSYISTVTLSYNNWNCSVLYNIIKTLESRKIHVTKGGDYISENVQGIPCNGKDENGEWNSVIGSHGKGKSAAFVDSGSIVTRSPCLSLVALLLYIFIQL